MKPPPVEANGLTVGIGHEFPELLSDFGDGVVESEDSSSVCRFARYSATNFAVFPPNGDSERSL
jgi:hypothetical protein